jgi:hypothetical protein
MGFFCPEVEFPGLKRTGVDSRRYDFTSLWFEMKNGTILAGE